MQFTNPADKAILKKMSRLVFALRDTTFYQKMNNQNCAITVTFGSLATLPASIG